MSYVRSARSCCATCGRMSCLVLVAIFALYLAPCLPAQTGVDDGRFAAHVAAGEFGPAARLANQAADPARRDAMLLGVAKAQARAGARLASLNTAASIGNDMSRSGGFESLSGHPLFFGGARGGAAFADFDTLIELIKSTVSPDSWDDNGGPGAAEPFPGGVFVDATGVMQRMTSDPAGSVLMRVRRAALVSSGNRDVRQKSALRKVSLTRLERHAQLLWARGQRPDEAMRVLAGLTKVKYVLVYPESRDMVIAGPADDWNRDPEGRLVNVETGAPVLQLDDLVVVLRNAFSASGRFGCSISPRRENLSSVQDFLSNSSARPLRPGERDRWLADLRERLGPQDIDVFGIDPRTRAARVLVEADYRMKLVGMGLEPGTLGVTSYLDSIEPPEGGTPPSMDVLRWWFTLNYEPLRATAARDAFELIGHGVKVLSENELLTERGERVHTGEATNRNRLFTQSFTKHFAELAIKYPIYAELRNVFDLALVAAVIHEEDLAARCQWQQPFFGSQGKYQVELGAAPKQVESVINHRLIDRKHLVVGVSGGVNVDTNSLVKASGIKTDTYGLLSADRAGAVPPNLPQQAWWWD